MAQRMKSTHPLKFHNVHGKNIKLQKDRTIAFRSKGFCKALTFSDRPVSVGEIIYIKFLEISADWNGVLRIGFTTLDPEDFDSQLPRHACPDLTLKPGNWAKVIPEHMTKKNSILYYYVNENGDVHFGFDSKEYGVLLQGITISSQLWAVIDIYGNTVAIELLHSKSLNLGHDHSSFSGIEEIQNLCTLPPELYSPLFFHTFHGKNVLLENRCIATRKLGCDDLAYVFTEHSLSVGERIRLQVLQIDFDSNKRFVYGITFCDPSTLSPEDLPDIEDYLLDRPEYWVVKYDSNNYKVRDTIDYHFCEEGKLVVMKNDKISTELYIDTDQPFWLFLNVTGPILEIFLSSLHSDASDIVTRFENMKTSTKAVVKDNDLSQPGTSGLQICTVCYEEPVNSVLYRCGHMCMCYICAMKIWKFTKNIRCPICRKVITDVIKIYK